MTGRVLARCGRRGDALVTDAGEVYGSRCVMVAAPMGLGASSRGTHEEGLLSSLRQLDHLVPGGTTEAHCPKCGVRYAIDHDALRRVIAAPSARPLRALPVT